jgi:sugar phosphate isomerase/epimerase
MGGCVRYGLSTHLLHDVRLTGDHLRAIAGAGFAAVELFCSRSHFDYHDPAAASALAGWLNETGLELTSVHAPIAEGLTRGVWRGAWSNAASDPAARAAAVREATAALDLARAIPYRTLVTHVGVPAAQASATDNQRDQAVRSLGALNEHAAGVGVALALEVMPNRLSSPDALRSTIDQSELEGASVCLDLGHAHLMGDVVDAVETLSGYLSVIHVHDNRGRQDDHLMPFDGTIDWDRTLLALQKVGCDGPLVFELASAEDFPATLKRAAAVRERFEALAAYDSLA